MPATLADLLTAITGFAEDYILFAVAGGVIALGAYVIRAIGRAAR